MLPTHDTEISRTVLFISKNLPYSGNFLKLVRMIEVQYYECYVFSIYWLYNSSELISSLRLSCAVSRRNDKFLNLFVFYSCSTGDGEFQDRKMLAPATFV
jgi:hypothetical protein